MTFHARQMPSRAHLDRSRINAARGFFRNPEVIAALLILIFPVMGTFFAPESYFAPQDFSIEGADNREVGFPFGRVAFMLIIFWEAYLAWRLPKTFIAGLRQGLFPITYAAWAIVTGFWTYDPSLSINRSVRVLILCFFAAYLAERFSAKVVLKLIAISTCVAIVASIFAAVALPQYGRTTLIGYEGAWRGATQHKNALGALMAWMFVFACYAFYSRAVSKRLGIFLMLGSPFLIIMARSATSLITAILAIALISYFSFVNRLKSRAEKFFMLVVGICGLAFAYFGQILLEMFLQLLGRSSDFTGRSDVWSIAWQMIQRRPIWGYGSSFWSIDSPDRNYVWVRLGWAPPHSHNNFLDFWLQLGLPGLILMLLIIFLVVARIIFILISNKSTTDHIWPIVIILIYFGGLTETNLVESSSGVFWLTICYIFLAKATRKSQPAHSIY